MEDLKSVGYKESEIRIMTEQDSENEGENSAERKRRQVLRQLQSKVCGSGVSVNSP